MRLRESWDYLQHNFEEWSISQVSFQQQGKQDQCTKGQEIQHEKQVEI